mmetsp:Transcript_28717/g.46115  ORF Transcript_28717/g.46115 Transcript_28717/m.46115 type:complete len:88 (+) Transcript_28717:2-265(+)
MMMTVLVSTNIHLYPLLLFHSLLLSFSNQVDVLRIEQDMVQKKKMEKLEKKAKKKVYKEERRERRKEKKNNRNGSWRRAGRRKEMIE